MGAVILQGIKLIGVVDLGEVDLKKRYFELLRNHSVHFIKRLYERYGISITFNQYIKINKKTKFSKSSKELVIKIKDINVRVIHRNKVLITALPL